jgi:anti-sigma factor RsiW
MPTCAHAERLVPLLYDGELDGPLRREVASHVSGCAVCTGVLASLERGRDLLRQEVEEQVEQLDFSGFWAGVAGKLNAPPLPWAVRLRLWGESWWPDWPLSVPVWAVAVAILLSIAALFLPRPYLPPNLVAKDFEQSTLVANNQAQIESLSSAATLSLWNEPTSNATVIWVGDDNEGGMP